MAELSKSDRGDETDSMKFSELLYGRHFRGMPIWDFVSFYHVFPLFTAEGCMTMELTISAASHSHFIFLFSLSKILLYSLLPFAVVFIGSTLFALQQLSGINAVFYFSSTVFRSAGVSSNLANIFVGIANLLGIFLLLSLIRNVKDIFF